MSAHMVADAAATPTTLDPTDTATNGGWLRMSAAMTDQAPDIADREDLVVTIAPGAGHGAPACFLPAHAAIEMDGTYLGTIDPATVTPHVMADRARYPVTWGMLVHECAHAAHSRWDTTTTGGAVAEAAMVLEESRIEAAQIRRRPDDRYWLRAMARDIILADTKALDPAHGPAMTPADAARAAALTMARVDAGILNGHEVAPVARIAEQILGADKLAELRRIWQAAHQVEDTDTTTMLELARQWCHTLGTDPDGPATSGAPHGTGGTSTPGTGGAGSSGTAGTPGTPGTTGTPGSTGTGEADGSDGSGGSDGGNATGTPTPAPAAVPSPLAEAIVETTTRVAGTVAMEPEPADPAAQAAAAREAEDAATKEAARAARRIFGAVGGPRTGVTAIAGTRPPSTDEHAAARRLASALSTAGVRERSATRTTSAMPPGRLRMRGALVADAQRAAGAIPTAEPFTRTTRKHTPTPPLRLGIACDVSGSMAYLARHVASAAWILARAAELSRVEATTATVIFGRRVRAITHPGTTPTVVTEFAANDRWEEAPVAIDALDAALDLSRPGAARLLVIISDGQWRDRPLHDAHARVARLRKAGCAVLVLGPARRWPIPGTTAHTLDDPTTTARAIAHAATTALRATH